MEVSEVVSSFDGVLEANIYGVQIPGKDGRACMAALTMEGDGTARPNPEQFAQYVRDSLPDYSIPLFIRFLPKMQITGTFKHQKVALRNEGMDVSKFSDEMWWFNPSSRSYEPFRQPEYESIMNGTARV